ncbi:MAG TPA: hypothetical protein PLZ58_00470 [Candidatus Saccharibacteria bacterium]|nr:hypothetical protein [Candidatus Saccharibacteria bacterium]HRQ07206.1 hypothetical protein [Candidatus Saccharibacteria bacterium]
MKPQKYYKSKAILRWSRKNWLTVLFLVLYTTFIILFMMNGVDFLQAVSYTFKIVPFIQSKEHNSNDQFFSNLFAIVIVVALAIIVFSALRHRPKK